MWWRWVDVRIMTRKHGAISYLWYVKTYKARMYNHTRVNILPHSFSLCLSASLNASCIHILSLRIVWIEFIGKSLTPTLLEKNQQSPHDSLEQLAVYTLFSSFVHLAADNFINIWKQQQNACVYLYSSF